MKLQGKVALVTGGAKRVGREIALTLAGRGAHVAITYRVSQREARSAVAAIRKERVKGLAICADQRQGAQVRDAVAEVQRKLGRVDILINNASSYYPTPLPKVTEAQWEDLIGSNLTGPWRFAQAVAPHMKRQGAGKIINLIDVAVHSPWENYLPFYAAKGGLYTLTLGLAKALAPKIQVNGIAPGPVLMPPGISKKEKQAALKKTLLKRSGSPKDVAHTALYLLEGTDFVTGVVIPVDGGRRLA